MRCASEAFYRRLLNFLYARGLTPIEHAAPDEPLEIYRSRRYICSFCPDGTIYSEKPSEDLNAIREFWDQYYTNYVWCEYLPKMPYDSVKKYAKFYEAGNAVLGGVILENDQIQYATWEIDHQSKTIRLGHYFVDDFAAAKEDFAIRAGLIDSQKLFQRPDMKAVYAACVYLLVSNDSLSLSQKQRLSNIIDRIEAIDESIPSELKEAMLSPQEESEDEEDLEADL